jgi:DNA-binding MarR family transcriptional regulator
VHVVSGCDFNQADALNEILGTGRHLTAVELRAWTSFLDAGRMIDEVMAKHLVEEHSMTHRDYEVLVRLDGAGGSMRMSVLARQIVASAPLVTQTVERLEKRGWVERSAVVGDARGVEAVLLAAGRSALSAAAEPHASIVRKLLVNRISPESLPQFAEAMGDVADHLRAHRRGEICDDDECPVLRFE